MENIKTLWELLQEVVEKEEKRFSLYEFLEDATKEEKREVKNKLVDADYKQFYEYMDGFNFVNEQEVEMAVCEYVEHVNQRPLCMWEMWDMRDVAEDYIRERKLKFEEEEIILPF